MNACTRLPMLCIKALTLFLFCFGFFLCLTIETTYAQSQKLRYKQYSCKTLDDAMACSAACEESGDIDFRVSVEHNYVIRKAANGYNLFGISIKNLGDCGVWDEKNWRCEERDPHPIHYIYNMINGKYFAYLLGQNSNTYFCAK